MDQVQSDIKKPSRNNNTLWIVLGVVAAVMVLAVMGLGGFVVITPTTVSTAKLDRAKMDVKSLETAVTTYRVKHSIYPATLMELTLPDPFDGTPPLLTDKALIDPWNQPYLYEPGNLHPVSRKPLIYSKGPPGENQRITNWAAETAPR